MNCGVPVIATDVGGLPEVVSHGETGYLFPVGDIAAMAAGAVEFLTDTAKHEAFKERARKRAQESFNADDIIPRYEAFYEELLRQ
jgi:glycosyltransferase involved in cell wall biosynthesis